MKVRVYLQRDKISPKKTDDGFLEETICAPATLTLKEDNGAFYVEFSSPVFDLAPPLRAIISKITVVAVMHIAWYVNRNPGIGHFVFSGGQFFITPQTVPKGPLLYDVSVETNDLDSMLPILGNIANGNYR